MKIVLKILVLSFFTIVLFGCTKKADDIPCYESDEFKEAIKILENTDSIVICSRRLDENTREIVTTEIKKVTDNKVEKIINILSSASEWIGPVTQPFPPNELQFFDKNGEKIAVYIYNGASDLVVNNKTFVLTDFDKDALDKLINNYDSPLKKENYF